MYKVELSRETLVTLAWIHICVALSTSILWSKHMLCENIYLDAVLHVGTVWHMSHSFADDAEVGISPDVHYPAHQSYSLRPKFGTFFSFSNLLVHTLFSHIGLFLQGHRSCTMNILPFRFSPTIHFGSMLKRSNMWQMWLTTWKMEWKLWGLMLIFEVIHRGPWPKHQMQLMCCTETY